MPRKKWSMGRLWIPGVILGVVFSVSLAWAQKTVRLSIATGSTGGVYYPLGEGVAHILSKYISYAEVTAEVTNGSVDNCRWVGMRKADLALILADAGWEAYQGRGAFPGKIPLRAVAALYPNHMHVVTAEGKGIGKVTDLKGKRVSTGGPGGGTEIMALRLLEAYGLEPDKDMKRDRLLPTESAAALKEREMDAFFWVGGLPTASIMNLGATPGIQLKLIGHDDAIPIMREKHGPIYVRGTIPAKTYPRQGDDVPVAVVWTLLVCNEGMQENLVYDIVKALFEHKPEGVTVHSNAEYLSLEPQVSGGSPIPFHPGAIRYFTEKGLKIK